MLNVTIKFAIYCTILLFSGCSSPKKEGPDLENLHYADSVSEARIDSAYAVIRADCDTLMKYKAPAMADSLQKDSSYLLSFTGTGDIYTDADKKVEKVIRQLQAECDSNLLKETYRIARQRKLSKPVRHKRAKA